MILVLGELVLVPVLLECTTGTSKVPVVLIVVPYVHTYDVLEIL